jgi:hypothetical protein
MHWYEPVRGDATRQALFGTWSIVRRRLISYDYLCNVATEPSLLEGQALA